MQIYRFKYVWEPFSQLNARMVQSVESVMTVLNKLFREKGCTETKQLYFLLIKFSDYEHSIGEKKNICFSGPGFIWIRVF